MSNYLDVIRTAIVSGFTLDSCGTDERGYTYGSFIDLCGLPIEEAIPQDGDWDGGGGSSKKKKNTITLSMGKTTSGDYTLRVTAAEAPTAPVAISFSFNGETHVVELPAGETSMDTGLVGEDPQKPYAQISAVVVNSEDEKYTYTSSNVVKTGYFSLKITTPAGTTDEKVKYGESVTLPAQPEKEGYDFVYKDSNGNTIDPNAFVMPEKDITITGTYVAKDYTLTCIIRKEEIAGHNETAEVVESEESITVKYNASITSILNQRSPNREGYTKTAWSYSDTVTGGKMPAKDITATITYKLNQYTFSVVFPNSTVSEPYLFGEQITPVEPIEITGHDFVIFDPVQPDTMPAHNVTVTAVYRAIPYHITYYVDGVQKYEETHFYNDAISIKADESKVGYTFSGWDPSELPQTMPANDIEVYGTFQINTYHLSVYVDGNLYFEKDYEYGATIDKSEIADPDKEGYTFTGWNPEIPDTVPANDVEVNAQFQINTYAIEYYVDGEPYAGETLEYNAEITPLEEPEREGYTFSGWSDIPQRMPVGGVRVDGTFSINSYELTYNVDGQAYTAFTVEYGSQIVAIEEPEREGYTFSGWDDVPATMPAHDVTVSGEFIVNTWDINYYVDGELYLSAEHDFGEAIVMEPIPEPRTGYTFSGWTYDEFPATMPNHDINVYGTFEVNEYTLSFNLDGEPYTSITADYGSAITAPTVSGKTGYTFSGWNPAVPATMPAEDMTFNGTYDINSHTASYVIDGQPYTSVTYQYGATIDYPDVPRTGYTLNWTKDYLTMPDMDITINGTYVEFVESTTVYYGMRLNSELDNFSGYTELDNYEYENGVEVPKAFVIPASAEYLEVEDAYNNDEITDEEWEQWLEDNSYGFVVMIPASTTFVLKNAGGVNRAPQFTQNNANLNIDGTDYKVMVLPTENTCVGTDTTYNMRITVQK